MTDPDPHERHSSDELLDDDAPELDEEPPEPDDEAFDRDEQPRAEAQSRTVRP